MENSSATTTKKSVRGVLITKADVQARLSAIGLGGIQAVNAKRWLANSDRLGQLRDIYRQLSSTEEAKMAQHVPGL